MDKISNKDSNWFIVELIEKCEPIKRNESQEENSIILSQSESSSDES